MRALIFFATLLLIHLSILAQPTIEASDLMTTGDTVRISIASDNSVDFSSTGPNHVWDYSFLEAGSQQLVRPNDIMSGGFLVLNRFGPTAGSYSSDYYQSFTGIPFDQFGSFLPVNIEDVYRFTRVRNDAQRFTGLSLSIDGNQVAFRSDTIETVYNFPLNYGDSNQSVGYTVMNFNPFFDGIFKQYRKRETTVDGHGTLITPFGTFNTIRVHHEIRETDSLYVDNPIFPQTIPLNLPTTHEYEWITKNQKLPVLKITTQVLAGNETVTEVTYRDRYLVELANLPQEEITLHLYPNPVSEKLYISSNQKIETITLLTVNGQQVDVPTLIDGNIADLSLHHVTPGVYFVKIQGTSQHVTRKIIVQ